MIVSQVTAEDINIDDRFIESDIGKWVIIADGQICGFSSNKQDAESIAREIFFGGL